ncbi:unnamed protein product [Rhodiola kirilowii]
MTILVWNCRGIGSPRAVRCLRDLVTTHRPHIVGLLETKANARRWETLKSDLGFINCFVVNSKGKSGGLAILWTDATDLVIQNFSDYHIDCVIKGAEERRLTVFYGNPIAHFRWRSWILLNQLHDIMKLPWCVCGDFNEILKATETLRNADHRRNNINQFREVVRHCDLIDVGYKGYVFTFSNKRKGETESRSRLDRALVNHLWKDKFPITEVTHISTYHSDHSALLIKYYAYRIKPPNNFKFEPMWLRDPKFLQFIETKWHQCPEGGIFTNKIAQLTRPLWEWNKYEFGNVNMKIDDLKRKLENIRTQLRTEDVFREEQEITEDLDEWLLRKEIMWRQRARTSWIKEGDNNTSFFHKHATQRKSINRITTLQLPDSSFITDPEKIMKEGTRYFQELFRHHSDTSDGLFNNELHILEREVTDEHNDYLNSPYTEEDIKRAVFDINPYKAPGHDGFSSLFIQKCWHIVKNDFIRECLDFLNAGYLNPKTNITRLVLIPKFNNAKKLQEYRPISLCTITAKTIGKAIVHRLQSILGDVISPTQSAFIPNRLITDNILLAHEVEHYIRNCKKQKSGYASLKLDMSKAYDRVDWKYLRLLLVRLGFCEGWAARILQYVSTVSYELSINGQIGNRFYPLRGLRQGDPLSPYLYIICTEWLTRSLQRATELRAISGIKVSRRAPVISHLCFADDCIIYFKVTDQAVQHLKNLLSTYEQISGQQINYQKSELVVSTNTSNSLRIHVANILLVPISNCHKKYLGTTMDFSKKKSERFATLVDKLWDRTANWCTKSLSMGGKEILIKSILYALPQYHMSCFMLPESILNSLTSMVHKFWWGSTERNRKMHLINRKICQKPREEGGLGFRDFKCINLAFLCKQAWRMATQPELLLARTFKSKYFPHTDILQATKGYKPSPVWLSILKGIGVLKAGSRADRVSNTLTWIPGSFNIKSAYKVAMDAVNSSRQGIGESSNPRILQTFWSRLWKLNLPRKVKIFAWRLYHDGIPTAVNLHRRGISLNTKCKLCGYEMEDEPHLFLHCWWTRSLWDLLRIRTDSIALLSSTMGDWLFYYYTHYDSAQLTLMIMVHWYTWFNRNNVWHGKSSIAPNVAAQRIKGLLKEYQTATITYEVINCSQMLTWEPPQPGYCKINCDAATRSDKSGAVAAVVRDSKGIVLCLRSFSVQKHHTVVELELRSILVALTMAREMKLNNVIIESDSIQVVEILEKQGTLLEDKDLLVAKCTAILADQDNFKLQFARREANGLADFLAKKVLTDKWSWFRMDCCPRINSDHIHLL